MHTPNPLFQTSNQQAFFSPVDENVINSNSQNSTQQNIIDSSGPFIFSKGDQRRDLCYGLGICDLYGKATDAFKNLPLITPNIDPAIHSAACERIKNALKAAREILKQFIPLTQKEVSVHTSMLELFKHLWKLYSKKDQDDSAKKKIFQIIQIYWIGSSALAQIGKEIIQAAAVFHLSSPYLKDKISEDEINDWFQNDVWINRLFEEKGNDTDIRNLISSEKIEDASVISDEIINFLADKIPNEIVTSLHYYYDPKMSAHEIKVDFFKHSIALKDRKRVNEEHTKFTLVGLNTDLDLNTVNTTYDENLQIYHPILEVPNLTSLNSIYISLIPFLTEDSVKTLSFFSSPHGFQVILDIIFNCATSTTHNIYGWLHSLRKYTRKLDPDDNKEKVKSVLNYRSKFDFLTMTKCDYRPTQEDSKTMGGYIYCLILKEFSNAEKIRPGEPYGVSELVFRACQSLSVERSVTEKDLAKIWDCVQKYYWLPKNINSSSDSIFTALKEAMIDDQIPFTVLSSLVGILAYLCEAELATTHCQRPIIPLEKPFSVFSPIQVMQDCERLDDYFSQNPLSKSVIKIIKAFINSHEMKFEDFPLTSSMPQLKIDPRALKRLLERWINGSASPLGIIGLQLYLTFYQEASDQVFFREILQQLPKILTFLETKQQKTAIILALQNIAEKECPEALSMISRFPFYNFTQSSHIQWMELLLDSHTNFSLMTAYKLFDENRAFFLNQNICCRKLFRALIKTHFYYALKVFLLVQKQGGSNSPQDSSDFTLIIHEFSHLNSVLQLQNSPGFFKALQLFFDFKENQKTNLSASLKKIFSSLLSIAFLEKECCTSVMAASRLGILIDQDRRELCVQLIKTLLNRNHVSSAIQFYSIARTQGWITVDILKENYSNNMQQFCEELLKNQAFSHVLEILETLGVDQESTAPHCKIIIKHLSLSTSSDEGCQMIQSLLKIVQEEDLLEVGEDLLKYFKEVFNTEKEKNSLDSLLIHQKLFKTMAVSPIPWREFLLDYLEKSEMTFFSKQEGHLWRIFERVLGLSKDKNIQNLQKIYDRFDFLLKNSSGPSEKILLWLETSGKNILKQMHDLGKIEALKTLLKFLKRQNISIATSDEYLWKVCLKDSNAIQGNTLDLFMLGDLQNLKSISINEQSTLLSYIAKQFDLFPDNPKTLKWLEWVKQHQETLNPWQATDLLIQYSQRLLTKKNHQYAFSIISQIAFENVEQNHSIRSLFWECFEKMLPNLSKDEQIQLVAKYGFLKEDCSSSLVSIILTTVLKNNNCTCNDLNLIFQLILSTRSPSLELWSPLWSYLEQLEPNSANKTLISTIWNSYKALKQPKGELANLIKYWLPVFNCLRKISHPDLLIFLKDTDWLQEVADHPKLIPLAQELLLVMILGAVNLIDLDNLDENLVDQIEQQRLSWSEKLTNHPDLRENWNEKVESALIERLLNSKRIIAAKLYTLKITEKLRGQKVCQISDWIKRAYQFFVTLSDDSNPISEYAELKSMIIELSRTLGQHRKFPFSPLLNVFAQSQNEKKENFFYIWQHFFSSIFPEGRKQDQQAFLDLFFKQLSNVKNNHQMEIAKIQLAYSFEIDKHYTFSQQESKSLAEAASWIFHASLHESFAQLERGINEAELEDLTRLYIQYAPLFIYKENLHENAINEICTIVKKCGADALTKIQFNQLMDGLLSIGMDLNTPDYDNRVFMLVHTNLNRMDLFVEYIHRYVEGWLEKVKVHSKFTARAAGAVFIHGVFFPPILKFKEKFSHHLTPEMQHWLNHKKLFRKAENMQVFKKYFDNWLILKMWDIEEFDWNTKGIEIKHIETIIKLYCECKFSNDHLWHTIKLLEEIMRIFWKPDTDRWKCKINLKNNYLKVLEATKDYSPVQGKFGKAHLFKRIVKNTFENFKKHPDDYSEVVSLIPPVKPSKSEKMSNLAKKQLADFFHPYFCEIMTQLKDHSSNEKYLLEIIHLFILNIFRELNPEKMFLQKMDFVTSSLKTALIQIPVPLKKSKPFYFYHIDTIDLFLTSMITHLSCYQKQNEFLLQWMDSICEENSKDLFEQKINTIIISLFTLLLYKHKENTVNFNYKNHSKIEAGILNLIEQENHEHKKIILNALNLYFTSSKEYRLNQFLILKEHLDFSEELIEKIGEKDFIAFIEIVFSIFLKWGSEVNNRPIKSIETQNFFEFLVLKIKKNLEGKELSEISTKFLLAVMLICFENRWMDLKRKNCLDFFEWISSLNSQNDDPVFTLMHYTKKFLGNEEDFQGKMEELMTSLAPYVVKNKMLQTSYYLVEYIANLKIDVEKIKVLLINWLKELNRYKPDEDHCSSFREHFTHLNKCILVPLGIFLHPTDYNIALNEKRSVNFISSYTVLFTSKRILFSLLTSNVVLKDNKSFENLKGSLLKSLSAIEDVTGHLIKDLQKIEEGAIIAKAPNENN